MGNILKKFALNKTTVTILGLIAMAAVLIIGYTMRTNNSTTLTTAYYVIEQIDSNTQLDEKKIKKIKINKSLTEKCKDIITNINDLRDKSGEFLFVNYGHTLTKGSLITKGALIEKKNKSDEKLYNNLKEDETIFKIDVDLDLTHGNSIMKGNAIDLYVKGEHDNEVIYTKFIENLRVIDVVDNKWATTKDSSSSESTSAAPKYIVTAVDEEMFKLLSVITLVDDYSFKLVPEDTRVAYKENTEAKIVNTSLKDLVEANTTFTN